MTLNQIIQTTSQKIQMRFINQRLPMRLIHIAPSGQASWFDVQEIEFDANLDIFWCSGVQYFEDSQGAIQTMRRCVPSYTLFQPEQIIN